MITNFDNPADDKFAQQQLQKLLGKHLLVKISYTDNNETIISEELIHGTIQAVNRENGITILLTETGQSKALPLNAATLEMSRFRDYALTDIGEKITGVDYTMSLTIKKTQ